VFGLVLGVCGRIHPPPQVRDGVDRIGDVGSLELRCERMQFIVWWVEVRYEVGFVLVGDVQCTAGMDEVR
jgi:hypothetical protein